MNENPVQTVPWYGPLGQKPVYDYVITMIMLLNAKVVN